MHKFTYIPEFGAEYTPLKSAEFVLDDEVTWGDILPVFIDYLRAATFVIPQDWSLVFLDKDGKEVEAKKSWEW